MNVLDKSRNALERAERTLDAAEFRPLSTRSLLLSFLLGTHPPELHVAHLTSFGERFGVREGTVRTALSRMVAAEELITDGVGRYRLAGRLVERQRQQDAGLSDPPDTWDGSWWTVIVDDSDRSATERRRFRSSMVGARMGELRPDIWMRPANIDGPPELTGVITTRGPLRTDDEALVDRLWDIHAHESDASTWAATLTDLDGVLTTEPADALPIAFDVSAAVVRFLRTEPQLPRELADMSACRELRHRYRDFNRRFRTALDDWLRVAT